MVITIHADGNKNVTTSSIELRNQLMSALLAMQQSTN